MVKPPRVNSGRKSLLLIDLEGQREQEVSHVSRNQDHLAGAGAMAETSGVSWKFSTARQSPKERGV